MPNDSEVPWISSRFRHIAAVTACTRPRRSETVNPKQANCYAPNNHLHGAWTANLVRVETLSRLRLSQRYFHGLLL